MDRRTFLADMSRYAFLCAGVPTGWRVTSRPRLTGDPFTLGVASRDPQDGRCVIWTRLIQPGDPEEEPDGVAGPRPVAAPSA